MAGGPVPGGGGDAVRVTFASRTGRLILITTILASGMAFLDSTVVNVALPRIEEDLGGGFATIQWVLDAYLLTLGSLVLVGGALGDSFGRKRVFVWGVVSFAITSVLCGLAPTAATLIIARGAQGVAAALMIPGSLALISSLFVAEDRGRAIGAWSGLTGLVMVIGPFIGGFLVDSSASGWRWIFMINLPLAAVVVWLARGISEPSQIRVNTVRDLQQGSVESSDLGESPSTRLSSRPGTGRGQRHQRAESPGTPRIPNAPTGAEVDRAHEQHGTAATDPADTTEPDHHDAPSTAGTAAMSTGPINPSSSNVRGQVDFAGAGLTAIGLALIVGPLIEYQRLSNWIVALTIAAGFGALISFWFLEKRREVTQRPPPMMPTTLWRIRSFSMANLITFFIYGALGAMLLLFTIGFQIGLGWSALAAGAAGLPITLVLALLSAKIGSLLPRFGSRTLLTIGAGTIAVGAAWLALLPDDATYWRNVLPAMLVFAVGLAFMVAPITTTALGDIPVESSGVGSGVNNAVARIAGLIAVALVPLLAGLTGLSADSGQAVLPGYRRAMFICAGLMAIGAAVSWFGFSAETGKVPGAEKTPDGSTATGDDALDGSKNHADDQVPNADPTDGGAPDRPE